MNITIGGATFGVRSATIYGHLGDPYWEETYAAGESPGLWWGVDVEGAEGWLASEQVAPSFSCDSLLFAVRGWPDLEGQSVASLPGEEDEPSASSYFWSHETLGRSSLRFEARRGVDFRMAWEGTCDPMWSEPFRQGVSFRIEAWARFSGITVHGSECDTASDLAWRLGKYLSRDGLMQGPIVEQGRYESGVAMCRCHFAPRPA